MAIFRYIAKIAIFSHFRHFLGPFWAKNHDIEVQTYENHRETSFLNILTVLQSFIGQKGGKSYVPKKG